MRVHDLVHAASFVLQARLRVEHFTSIDLVVVLAGVENMRMSRQKSSDSYMYRSFLLCVKTQYYFAGEGVRSLSIKFYVACHRFPILDIPDFQRAVAPLPLPLSLPLRNSLPPEGRPS